VGTTVVVSGAVGPLGRRVCELAAADPDVDRLVVVDPSDPQLAAACAGASVVVHLGAVVDGEGDLDGTGTEPDVAGARRLLAAADEVGARTVVVLSSALVYGAWPNNPVPLTEDAALRPDPALRFAVEKAELERLAAQWRAEHEEQVDDLETGGPGACTVAVLRPTVTVSAGASAWLARSPWSAAGVQIGAAERPAQFVHLDDLAAAVDLARRERLDGAFNVAPDGWIPGEQLRALAGPVPRLHLPAAVAERFATLGWSIGATAAPPAVITYRTHPWVVANDRLREAGWVPAHTNEEAFVEADDGGPLGSLDARRRQLLSLGAVAGVLAGVVAGVAVLLRRRRT